MTASVWMILVVILLMAIAGRAHAVWHGFTDTPAHLVMLELLARWFHPDRLGNIDPAETLRLLNEQFLSIPMRGTFWVDLPALRPGVLTGSRP